MFDFSDNFQAKTNPCKTVYQGNILEDYRQEAQSIGLLIDSLIIDGEIHRVSTQQYPHRKDGWYCFKELDSGYFFGSFGDWADPYGTVHNWTSWNEQQMSFQDKEAIRIKIEEEKKKQQLLNNAKQVEQANRLFNEYSKLSPCPNTFGYLQRKKVSVYGDIRYDSQRDCMVIPLVDKENVFIGCQRIYNKKIESIGTDKTTHGVVNRGDRKPFFTIPGDSKSIYMVEGYSTGASIYEATGNTVIVALFAGRLSTIAQEIKQVYPQSEIIIAADNDCTNKVNTGVLAAKKAAKEIGAEVLIPELNNKKCDWNDFHCEMGVDALKMMLGKDGKSPFGLISLKDICDKQYPDNPVFRGLLDEQESLLIIGGSNIGKSLITLTMAAFLGNPELKKMTKFNKDDGFNLNSAPKLFGHFPPSKFGKTLFIQSENGGKGTKSRTEKMIEGNDLFRVARENDNIFFLSKEDVPCVSGSLLDPTFFNSVKIAIKQYGFRMVVIDPLISFHEEEENNNAEIRKFLDKSLKRLMIETNVSTVVIHHMGKDESRGARGGTALKDWADGELIISEVESFEDGESILKFEYSKSRNFSKNPPLWYCRRTKDLCIVLEPDYEESSSETEKKTIKECDTQDVINILIECGGSIELKSKLINKLVGRTGSSKASAERAIKRCLEAELIDKEENGLGKGHTFRLVD